MTLSSAKCSSPTVQGRRIFSGHVSNVDHACIDGVDKTRRLVFAGFVSPHFGIFRVPNEDPLLGW